MSCPAICTSQNTSRTKKAVEWASSVGQEIEQQYALVQVGGFDVLRAFPHKYCKQCQWCTEQQGCYQNMEKAA
jgi:ArsR family metal-binding transcriptional regulator